MLAPASHPRILCSCFSYLRIISFVIDARSHFHIHSIPRFPCSGGILELVPFQYCLQRHSLPSSSLKENRAFCTSELRTEPHSGHGLACPCGKGTCGQRELLHGPWHSLWLGLPQWPGWFLSFDLPFYVGNATMLTMLRLSVLTDPCPHSTSWPNLDLSVPGYKWLSSVLPTSNSPLCHHRISQRTVRLLCHLFFTRSINHCRGFWPWFLGNFTLDTQS